jgi:DNA-binding transcriptional ArsR family regulator
MKNSIFIRYLGDSPKVRILDYLLTVRELDFSLSDIAENSGVGRATLYRLLDNMIKEKIIVPTRVIGKAKLFKLNTQNPYVKEIVKFHDGLLLKNIRDGKTSKKELKLSLSPC